MPNIKSAKKRVKVAERNRIRNRVWKSRIRTEQVKLESALKSSDIAACDEHIKSYYETIDKAIVKGVIHKNTGARKKSRIVKSVNKIKAQS